MANFFATVKEVAAKYPNNICFAEGEQTYGEVWRLAQARAAALRVRGIKKGDVVGVLSKNSPEWCITYTAILSVGALALVLDSNLRPDMYREMLVHVNTKILYTSALFAGEDYGVPQLSIEAADPYAAFEPEEKVEGSDLAMLLYTSGTTGNPKVVPLTHDNVIKTTQACIKHISAGPEDMFLTILPLYHVYGLVAGFLGGFLCGAALVFQNSLKGTDILNTLAKYPITVFSAVPQLWEIFFDQIAKKIKNESKFKHFLFMFVLRHAPSFRHVGLGKFLDKLFYPIHKAFGLKLRLLLCGGSRLGWRYCLYYKYMGFVMIEGYGLTETAGPLVGGDPKKPKPICVGKPLGENFVEVRNHNKDGIGDIWLKGVSVMPGYYKNPEATKAVFDADGWFDTGDMGFLDKQGELHIRGRRKNVIVMASGKNVYPEELEAYYLRSPLIEEITIFGRYVDRHETVFAVIRPPENTENAYAKLKVELKHLSHGLPTYKRISDFAVSTEPLPRTSTQKVKVHEVVALLKAGKYQMKPAG